MATRGNRVAKRIAAEPFAHTLIPGKWGALQVFSFEHKRLGSALAILPARQFSARPYVRIHSACFFGEVLRSDLCDCRQQLEASIDLIVAHSGIVVYLHQEGRGVGVAQKIKAMELERQHQVTTSEAFERLGFETDQRDYALAVEILTYFDVPTSIFLITNNPAKLDAVRRAGFLPRRIEPRLTLNEVCYRCVREKQRSLGHILYRRVVVKSTS